MNDLKVVDRTYKYLYKIDVAPRKKKCIKDCFVQYDYSEQITVLMTRCLPICNA